MFGKFIKGALVFGVGAAVGAGVLWLMSESGKETRDELRDLADKAKSKMQDYYEQVKEQVKQETEEQDGKANPV